MWRTVFVLVYAIVSPEFIISAKAQIRTRPIEIVAAVGHTDAIYDAVLSPDRKVVATTSSDKTTKLWDVASGRLIRTFVGDTTGALIRSIAFSSDGVNLISADRDYKKLQTWEIASGHLLKNSELAKYPIDGLAFSNDHRVVATSSDHVRLWDIMSGRLVQTMPDDNTGAVTTTNFGELALSPDLRFVLVDTGFLATRTRHYSRAIALWDVTTGKVRWQSAVPTGDPDFSRLAISPDGRIAAAARGKVIKVWDVASGKALYNIPAHDKVIISVSFSQDSKKIASSGDDNTLKLWDVETGKPLFIRKLPSRANSVSFSEDAHMILLGTEDGSALLEDVESGTVIRAFTGAVRPTKSAQFSLDGRAVLSSMGGALELWDSSSGQNLRSVKAQSGSSDIVYAVASSPNGKTAVSGGDDGLVRIWDMLSGQPPKVLRGHSGLIKSVAISSDGRRVLSGGFDDNTVKLWDAQTGKLIRSFRGEGSQLDGRFAQFLTNDRLIYGAHSVWEISTGKMLRTDDVDYISSSADGRVALSSDGDRKIQIWDSRSGKIIRTLEGYESWGTAGAFSFDGRVVAFGSSEDSAIALWDLGSGRILKRLIGHAGAITSVSFSLDSRRLASTATDGTVKLWDELSGDLLASFVAFEGGEWVTITPEGFFDASENGAKFLSVVRGLQVYSIDQFYDQLHRPDLVREKLAGDPRGLVREATARMDLTRAVATGSAPLVRITSPVATSATSSATRVTVEASIADQGFGIGKVEWRRNGTTIGVDTSGAGSLSPGRTVTLNQVLSLLPGDNRIEVLAYNGQGVIASEPVQVVIRLAQQQLAPPRLYVLAVGVNEYMQNGLHLNFAALDAQALGDGLRQAGGKLYERVEVRTVLDKEVTAANLDAVFGELSRQVRPQDVFVLFLSGHGKTVDGRFYFIPQDFQGGESDIVKRGIGQTQLQQWLARMDAQESLLLFDACESGSLTGDGSALREAQDKTVVDRLTRAIGRTVLTATTDDMPALEGYRGHGVFTYALLSALGEAASNGEGVINVKELAQYVVDKVPDLTYDAWHEVQLPQRKIMGSNFPLATKIALLPATPTASIPGRPTHRVINSVAVRQSANDNAPSVIKLDPGAQVRLVETVGGWVLVAREGRKLGYVHADALAMPQ